MTILASQVRYDISRLSSSSVKRTPQGGARIPARLTRDGVFVYRNADGTPRREYRPAEEVSKADSLETLADAPLIEGHPDLVTPENYRELERGHVSGTPVFDGRYVASVLVVQDHAVLGRIDSGDLAELSCGYTCDLDRTAGTFDGQPFDCIQRNIRYNHVGIGPKNWGRAGSDVALRLDSITYVDEIAMKKITLDGKEFEVTPELFEAFDAWSAKMQADVKTRVDAADKDAGKLSLDAANLKTRLDAAEAKVKELSDPARFDAAVEARATLVEQAHKILGVTTPFKRADGTPATNREIMVEVVSALKKDFKADGRTDDYVQALFDHAIESGVRADSITTLPGRLDAMREKPGDKENDSEPDKDADEKNRVNKEDAWQKPLSVSKDKK